MSLARLTNGLKQRLAYGIGMQALSFLVTVLLQILLVPVFLGAWGKAAYEDWLVLMAATGILSVLDLGCQGHLTNTLREAWASGDERRFSRILRSGLFTYIVLTLTWLTALLGGMTMLAPSDLLGLHGAEGANLTFLLLALQTLLMIPRGLVASVYSARGVLGHEVAAGLLLSAGQALAQAMTALAGGALQHAALASVLTTVLLGWGVLLFGIGRHFPDVRLSPQMPDGADLRRLAGRAPYYLLSHGAMNAIMQGPLLVLGRLAPEGAVVAFSAMRVFTGLVRQGAAQLATATGLEMARQHTQQDTAALRRLSAGTARLAAGLCGLGSGLLLVLGPPFFRLWTHGAVPFDPVPALVFLGGGMAMAPFLGSLYLLRFIDRPRVVAVGLCGQAAAAVLFCILLAPWGALGGTIAVVTAEVLVLGGQGLSTGIRLTGEPLRRHLARSWATALCGLLLGGGAALAEASLFQPESLLEIMVFTGLWAAAVTPPALFLLLNAAQREWLLGFLRRRSRPA